MEDKKKIIDILFERGVLVNKELLDEELNQAFIGKIETEADLIVLNSDYVGIIHQQGRLVDWYDLDKYRVDAEKERDDDLYQRQLQQFKTSSLSLVTSQMIEKQALSSLELAVQEKGGSFETEELSLPPSGQEIIPSLAEPVLQSSSAVTIVLSYKNIPKKYVVEDFSSFFVSRYRFLEGILRNRQELQNTLNINRILAKKEKEVVSVIGVVENIGETKAGNVMITLEDLTGKIRIVVSKNKKELFLMAKDVVADEVLAVSGLCSEGFLFAENLIWPDVPNNELKKGEKEEYMIFLSDIHVGSSLFLKEEFEKFLKWISGTTGNEQQRAVARNVKYIFIGGDLVDGVGIYPSQEDELAIKDISEQYAEFCRLIKQIPIDKQIIMYPGNHDVVYLAEPQPVFYQEFAPGLFDLPNVQLVTNPAIINIGKTDTFPGFDVLLYHGYSFDYYVANVESIRVGGGYHRSDLIMRFLLKRRHLAPSFTSTPYYPSHKEDPLLIRKVPDFFLTGHIHYSSVANYKGITMMSGSCWQGKTTFQEKLGHEPEPARVPVVNLKTREVKILRFG